MRRVQPEPLSTSGSSALAVLEAQLLSSVNIFRWAALAWASIGVVLSRDQLSHPAFATGLLGLGVAFTLLTSFLAAVRPAMLAHWSVLGTEIVIGITLLLGDGWVYETERSQSLPWAWPAAGIIAVGICHGRRAGLATGVLVGAVSMFTELAVLDRSQVVAAFSKIGLWLLVGAIAGALTERLGRAEQEISIARTREEVARELHDGVLQTLAVVQRRSGNPELAALAKDQENSLRRYLADTRLATPNDAVVQSQPEGEHGQKGQLWASRRSVAPVSLEATLRDVAANAERLYQIQVKVVVTPDCPDAPQLSSAVIRSIGGAVTEALTNACKHGEASKVTLFAEPSDPEFDTQHAQHGLFVNIKDNGVGFIIDEAPEGIGLGRSIRGRIQEQGGTVEVASKPGRGTEVKMWL